MRHPDASPCDEWSLPLEEKQNLARSATAAQVADRSPAEDTQRPQRIPAAGETRVVRLNVLRLFFSEGFQRSVFNHDVKTGTMTADAAKADCGHSCHMTVKSKDYVFHPYQKR